MDLERGGVSAFAILVVSWQEEVASETNFRKNQKLINLTAPFLVNYALKFNKLETAKTKTEKNFQPENLHFFLKEVKSRKASKI